MRPVDRSDSSIQKAAARWLARRDRGLSPSEQDAYLQWLREQPAHGEEITRLENAWRRLDNLQHWHPAHSSTPSPDLLAPAPQRRWLWPSLSLVAGAAALAIASLFWLAPSDESAIRHHTIMHPGARRFSLLDGSLVELNEGAKIEVNFTPDRRDVKLVRGEAHFVVAKNPNRPFVVTADKFSVRAVGTAFTMKLNPQSMSVLVTEGNVQLAELQPQHAPTVISRFGVGQLATIKTQQRAPAGPEVEVRDLSPAEIEAALAWQSLRLEFVDLPLREVVAEFNRYNSRKLVIQDARTGDIVIGGTFRADNVEAFVRLLDVGFGISAHPRGDDTILLARRD